MVNCSFFKKNALRDYVMMLHYWFYMMNNLRKTKDCLVESIMYEKGE